VRYAGNEIYSTSAKINSPLTHPTESLFLWRRSHPLYPQRAIAPLSFPRYTISPGIEAIPHQGAMEADQGNHITVQKTPFDTAN